MCADTTLRNVALTTLVVGAIFASACAARSSINGVLADPAEYRNRDVTITGTVVESFSLAERGAYLLDDGTGQLWVVSDGSTPRKGARVEATGTIRDGFNLGSLGDLIKVPSVASGLVLIESERDAQN